VIQLKNVKDLLGENESIRKAFMVSFVLWNISLVFYIFDLDSYCYGRSIITASIAISVVCFFFVQNIENIEHIALRKNRELEERLTDAILNPRNPDDEILPTILGGVEKKRSSTDGHLKQRMFSEAVLGKEMKDM